MTKNKIPIESYINQLNSSFEFELGKHVQNISTTPVSSISSVVFSKISGYSEISKKPISVRQEYDVDISVSLIEPVIMEIECRYIRYRNKKMKKEFSKKWRYSLHEDNSRIDTEG